MKQNVPHNFHYLPDGIRLVEQKIIYGRAAHETKIAQRICSAIGCEFQIVTRINPNVNATI